MVHHRIGRAWHEACAVLGYRGRGVSERRPPAAVAVVIAAPPASAGTPVVVDSPSVLAAALADAVTMVADAAQPGVVVDPSRWQTVANIAATSLNNADTSGLSGDTRNLLAGCLSGFAVAGSAASDVLGACADELGAVSESAGPG